MILGIIIGVIMVGVNIVSLGIFGLNWPNSLSGMFCAGCLGFCVALKLTSR
jgi:hypothetical protein